MDYLDTQNDTLYCSVECGIDDGVPSGDLVEFSPEEYEEALDDALAEDPDVGNPHGALCPICETPYAGYEAG